MDTPLRRFLRTETGSATVLLLATMSALIWVNMDTTSYEDLWTTKLSVQIGDYGSSHDLRYWVSSGLMTLFFFVIGLEARREFDIGELRDRRRLILPVAAGVGGMLAPVTVYLAFNEGHWSAYGWGAAMATDTAFALGVLALVGPRFPIGVRAFLLTISVVDDLVALVVIATVYARSLHPIAVLAAAGFLSVAVALARLSLQRGFVYATLGVAAWVSLSRSGVDPVVVGLVMGLLAAATPVPRSTLERASHVFRRFREQPTAELARSARLSLTESLSPNERLQQLFHPWTSYVIVPLFALANAGVPISWGFLEHAFSAPIALGILVGYVAGKPIGIAGGSWLLTRLSRGSVRPPVGWVALLGGGSAAGIGFTVALLIAGIAFHGEQLAEAKAGVLSAALATSGVAWLVFRTAAVLPQPIRSRALLGSADRIVDLAVPVDPARDHIRGRPDAPVTIVEYGDFECLYCGQAEPVLRELTHEPGDIAYVWRHLPLRDVHPHAEIAARAAEAAAAQGKFWEMHGLMLEHQDALALENLVEYASQLGLDRGRFTQDLEARWVEARIVEDVASADLSNVTGTPTFFINGRRHYGTYNLESLSRAVRVARASVVGSARGP